ncbi:hypothetical protein HanRHA438_Chr13g0587271 [Helianthus annuus]|nr:hypothetical protein HanRHA438_Chr13g0587271 [Helianthus annuus]
MVVVVVEVEDGGDRWFLISEINKYIYIYIYIYGYENNILNYFVLFLRNSPLI